MPVPAAITDLSTTPASNSPPGAETPTLGDDYLRTAFAFIKQVYDQLNASLVNLTTTGNTVLGNASTDTLDVGAGGIIKDASGNVGIGTLPVAGPLLTVNGPIQSNASGGTVDRYVAANITAIGAVSIGVNNSGSTNPYGALTGTCYLGSLVAPLAFTAIGTERGRFDSSGNLMVGTTSTSPSPGCVISPNGSAAIGNSAQASGWGFQYYLRSGVTIGSITQSGTTAVLYNTTSDERLKEAIVDAPDAGSIIDAIKVRSFTWKTAPDERVTHGFIAQELVAIAPQAVKVGDEGAEVVDAWAVDPSKLVPLLVKELQDCRARLLALETV